MKQGRYFRLPERPADVARLWNEAAAPGPAPRPDWMDDRLAAAYRYLGPTLCTPLDDSERQRYASELGELEMCGAFAHPDPDRSGVGHLYLGAPHQAVFSIGIYGGAAPWQLGPEADLQNPVLRREDVTDVVASFVADPFMLRAHGIWHMFFEVMNWRTAKGEIALATSEDGRRWRYEQVVLSEAIHLSYPYVFEWDGCYYMVPEGFQSGEVRLYRADDFPARWSCIDVLVRDPYCVDPSPFRHAGHWWMFTEANATVRHDTLRLYGAPRLTGPWTEHPSSPVVTANCRRARPAGRIVTHGGALVRFAQNCEVAYGVEVRAIEIDDLSELTYAEHDLLDVPVLAPGGHGWNAQGMHHVDPHPDGERWIACVDGWYEGI